PQSIALIEAVLTPSPQSICDVFENSWWLSCCIPGSSRAHPHYRARRSDIGSVTLHFKDRSLESPYEHHLFLAHFPQNSLTITLCFVALATVQMLLLPL